MKSGFNKFWRYLASFCYQIAFRMYEIFPKTSRPIGLWILAITIIVNLISLFVFVIALEVVDKKYEMNLIAVACVIGTVLAVFAIFKFHGNKELAIQEKQKGRKHNLLWLLITWLYMLITLALAIIVGKMQY